MRPLSLLIGAFAVLGFGTANANALELEIPVDCEVGADCYVQVYVDRDPGPGAMDYTCGSLTNDGQKGVGFRVPTFTALRAGVDVLAAASGRVLGVRDGEPDTGKRGMTAGRDCGNGVSIDHGDGWVTQYCHMAKGSLTVKAGDELDVGTRLGHMGFSGNTNFPHLHMSVRRNDITIDPFDARKRSDSCIHPDTHSLWSEAAQRQLAYRAGGVVDAGFATEKPSLSDIRRGTDYLPMTGNAPIIAFWARFFGLLENDVIRIRLQRPDGRVLANKDVSLERDKAEYFHFVGSNLRGEKWPNGAYVGSASLVRDGRVIDRISAREIVR